MSVFPREFVAQVRERNDLVDLVSDYVSLRKSGKAYVGLCPFHTEKTPSFSVAPDKQVFYCFGCQSGGDVFDFLRMKEGLEFTEAVEVLARRAGLRVPEAARDRHKNRERSEMLAALEAASRYFSFFLHRRPEGEKARNYLAKRGLSADVVREFELGFAPDSWDGLLKALKKHGFPEDTLLKAGLVVPREKGDGCFDRFRGRLMFPIKDAQGRTVGFGGRVLDESLPKYTNSPETAVFNKRRVLYALPQARAAIRETSRAIVVEGYLDAISAHQAGIRNVVASLGTALSEEQARALSRYAGEVLIAYDADTAGTKATLRGLEVFSSLPATVRVISLPEGTDPDKFLKTRGRKAFEDLIAGARPLMVYRFDLVMAKYGTEGVQGKVKIVEEVAPLLAGLQNAVERDEYIREFAARLGVTEDSLRTEVRRYGRFLEDEGKRHKKLPGRHNSRQPAHQSVEFTVRGISPGLLRAERDLLEVILRNPGLAGRVIEIEPGVTEETFFTVPVHRTLARTLFKLAREKRLGEIQSVIETVDNPQLRGLVSRLVIGEDRFPKPERTIDECIDTIKKHRMKKRIEEIQAEIEVSEARGEDIPRDLLRERHALVQKIHGF